MAYKDFSIESAIAPTYQRRSVKLQGVANAVKIMQNPSRSTEDYIQGAVTAIGAANRQILYVNSSLEALNDRLRIASKLAYAINTSKRRGAEGFNDVPMMDPWAFALEEQQKEGGFFRRVWEAIKTICRRVIDAIAHLIKWIANAFAGLDTKSQAKHYELYKKNISKLAKDKMEAVDKTEFKAPMWKKNITSGYIREFLTKANGRYIAMTGNSIKGDDVTAIEKLSNASTIEQFSKVISGISAFSRFDNEQGYTKKAKEIVDEQLADDLKALFGSEEKKSASELIREHFIDGKKKEEVTCKYIRTLTNEFDCLKGDGLAKAAKDAISTLHKHQKEFTEYTKKIDKFVTAFMKTAAAVIKNAGGMDISDKTAAQKMVGDSLKSGGKTIGKALVNKINNYLSTLSNTRIRYNSYWTGLMLDLQSMVLKYNKTAHIALKFYLKELKLITKMEKEVKSANKKAGVGVSKVAETTESLFNFF